jgi:hypothetical protein
MISRISGFDIKLILANSYAAGFLITAEFADTTIILQADACYGGHAPCCHFGISMFSNDVRMDISRVDSGVFADKKLKPRCIKHRS